MAKEIIDLPDDVKVAITQMGLLRIPTEYQKIVDRAIQHGTPIPKNATNKEVFSLVYPDVYKETRSKAEWDKWWNGPYEEDTDRRDRG